MRERGSQQGAGVPGRPAGSRPVHGISQRKEGRKGRQRCDGGRLEVQQHSGVSEWRGSKQAARSTEWKAARGGVGVRSC